MKLRRENRSTRGENCPSATLSTTNPTLTYRGLRGERPETNRLSHVNVTSPSSLFKYKYFSYKGNKSVFKHIFKNQMPDLVQHAGLYLLLLIS
jgi:hypothetical protein